MRNELKRLGKSVFRPIVAFYYGLTIMLIAAYVVLYQFAPLEESLNDVLLNSVTSFSAFIAAIIATAVFRHYQPEDMPRTVWLYIMLAGWMWFLGEVSWQVLVFYQGEVPVPSIADFFWVAGFVFFTLAFHRQYSIVMPEKLESIRTFSIGIWLVVLLIPAILLTLTDSFSLPFYVDFYYPFADLAVGLAGLALILIFRGGALMRPWIGLMLFGMSDLMYAWAEKTNIYAFSVENGNTISLFIDTSYLAAYLLLGLGFLGHWVLLHYGLQRK